MRTRLFFFCIVLAVLGGCSPPSTLTISILSVTPSQVTHGDSLNVTWQVGNTPTTISHTALHYSSASHPGVFTTDIAPQAAGYAKLTVPKQGNIPATFTDTIPAEETGNLYFRAHAIIDGKHYWTSEYRVPITPAPQKKENQQNEEPQRALPQPQSTLASSAVKTFAIEGDDNGLYPDTIPVMKGDLVNITFKVRNENVYFGGLDFRSNYFTTPKIPPGSEATVQFIAEQTFTFTSYWPASGVKKADGKVLVS